MQSAKPQFLVHFVMVQIESKFLYNQHNILKITWNHVKEQNVFVLFFFFGEFRTYRFLASQDALNFYEIWWASSICDWLFSLTETKKYAYVISLALLKRKKIVLDKYCLVLGRFK